MTTAPKPYPRHIRATQELIAGRWVKRCVVTCSVCRKDVETIRIPVNVLARVLANHGWVSGDDPKRATCPLCVASHTSALMRDVVIAPKPIAAPRPPVMAVALPPVFQKEVPMAVTKEVAASEEKALALATEAEAAIRADLKAATPRVAKPADNRRIADELEIHYDTDRLCYRGIASDLMIAGKLDVPRAWVADVREKMYGPEVPEAMRDAPARLSAFEAEFKALEDKALTLATEAEAARKRLKAYLKSIEGVAQ